MIRFDVAIRLVEIDAAVAQTAIENHHQGQPFSGDFFMPAKQLGGRHLAIEVDGRRVGVAAYDEDGLSLCTLDAAAKRFDRQIVETLLSETGATEACVASWDRHHVDLFGNFASSIANQAYQFELLDAEDLHSPVPGLVLEPASEADLPYLESTGFQPDFPDHIASGVVRVARLHGTEVGIAMLVPHILNEQRVDIGMFTDPDRRRRGIGRSILALAAREVLANQRRPVAGCGAGNWESRPTVEAAGLTCIGTIFRFGLDPDRFLDQL